MASKISVVIDVAVDRANRAFGSLRKSISDADGAVGKFKAGVASAGDSLKANIMPVAAAAGAAVAAFAVKSIRSASDLQESTNAVNVSFGEAAEGVLEIGENSAESMGLSKAAFNEAAVGFAAFADTIAGPGGDVADVIGEITTRASDFASVMNLEVSEATDVFRSALSGETEPIKKFGIDLSAAAVEAYALASGLVKSKSEMTEAVKVQARYGLLMEKTSKFAGDFANTSDGLANSTRIASARVEDFQAKIGEQLIPTVETAVGIALDLADAIDALGLAASNSSPKVGENASIQETATKAFLNAVNPLNALGETYDYVTGLVDEATGAFDESTSALDDQSGALVQASIDAAFLDRATRDLAAAQEDAKDAYIDHAKGMQRESRRTTDELIADMQRLRGEMSDRTAYLDVEEAFASMQEAGVQAFDGTEQSARDFERAQIAASEATLDYIDDLAGVPPEVKSEIAALIDEGAFEEVERRLASLERVRTTRIAVQNAGPSSYVPPATVSGYRASGGPVNAGGAYVVGEEGPELLQMGGSSGNIIPNDKLGGGGDTYVTINTQADPQMVIDAIRKWERKNGTLR